MQSFTLQECAYCGGPATTRDHIPPKGFFSSPAPSDLLTVPSCKDCNVSLSKDEEYVRNVLASTWADKSTWLLMKDVFNTKVTRSYQRSPKLLGKVWEDLDMKDVNVLSTAGLHLGKAVLVRFDKSRFNPVMAKIARGLHYLETGARATTDFVVRVDVLPNLAHYPDEIEAALHNAQPRGNHPEVFRYLCAFGTDKTRGSVWLMQFYQNVVALVIIKDSQF